MLLNNDNYKNKMLGCWLGKNIGGTLGMPFEWKRQINHVSFYSQTLLDGPVANDDLDLQLVWLLALEKYGYMVNSRVLAGFWLDYIIPNWVEYGICKTNLRLGLLTPLSGWYGNTYKDSCGAFIRSEIWACIAPGYPAIAAKYAYEDAQVDHADEGIYAEIFCAVIESAAFVESDSFLLIKVGLSAIPENCETAKGIRTVLRAYEQGFNWQTAREIVLRDVRSKPDNYIGEEQVTFTGYDAPINIAFIIIGWLYGNGDFGKSLSITVNCGDNTNNCHKTNSIRFGRTSSVC
jgi:ADP-ribosylglycohydrolase